MGLPQGVGGLRVAGVHAALIDARQHVGLARHDARANLHVADREEAAEPLLVVDFHRLAIADQADADVAFEVGDDLRALVRAGRGMVDPEDRFLADGRVIALYQSAVAPQQPDFIAPSCHRLAAWAEITIGSTLLPSGTLICGEERCRQQEDEGKKEPAGSQCRRSVLP